MSLWSLANKTKMCREEKNNNKVKKEREKKQ